MMDFANGINASAVLDTRPWFCIKKASKDNRGRKYPLWVAARIPGKLNLWSICFFIHWFIEVRLYLCYVSVMNWKSILGTTDEINSKMITSLRNTYINLRTHFSGISWWRYRTMFDKKYERMQIFAPALDIPLYVINKTQAMYLWGLI